MTVVRRSSDSVHYNKKLARLIASKVDEAANWQVARSHIISARALSHAAG